MRSKNVVLLESNSAVVEQLRDEMAKTTDFKLVYVGDEGDEGMRKILQLKPDVVITAMFLKGTDGSGVIQYTRKTLPLAKIIGTGTANDTLIEKALNFGADYYLVKPFSAETAVERIRELFNHEEIRGREFAPSKRRAITVDEKISEIFISIGIPPHIKGYSYLREGIKLTIEKPYIINSVTKELYPTIGKIFDTTASKVERAIRHAIEVAWNRGRIDAINAVFGTRVYLGTEKPTNSEFIALVADKLILESMI
jgi:two-component system response regulator (stage 0 sporulation protein A)